MEIKKVRETYIAFDNEEHTQGICAVGTSIIGPMGEIAAVSVPTPSVRFKDKKLELEAALKDCRSSLMQRFGNN